MLSRRALFASKLLAPLGLLVAASTAEAATKRKKKHVLKTAKLAPKRPIARS